MKLGAVILAAGASSRMGRAKQLVQIRGQSLLQRATRAALDAECDPVVVVTGAHADEARTELAGLSVTEAFNPSWDTGMSSSIATGVRVLAELDQSVSALVLMVCDQPYVDAAVIRRLISAYRQSGAMIVASSYAETYGVPALFDATLFDELMRLEGKSGAKPLIRQHESEARFVAFQQGQVDLDLPEDLALFLDSERPL